MAFQKVSLRFQAEQIFDSGRDSKLHRDVHVVLRKGEVGFEAQPLLRRVDPPGGASEAAEGPGHPGVQAQAAGGRH